MYQGSVATFTNREDWLFDVMEIVDDDTGELIDLTSALITVGIYSERGQLLAGSTDDGTITLPDSTSFQILFTRDQITGFCGTLNVGVTIFNGGLTKSFIVGSITVLQGFVPA